jgi:hypothetical protein
VSSWLLFTADLKARSFICEPQRKRPDESGL